LVYAATCLILSQILFYIAAGASGSLALFFAGLSITVPGLILYRAVGQSVSRFRAGFYILVLSLSLGFAAYTVLSIPGDSFDTAFTPLAFMSFALAMVGGAVSTMWERLMWLSLGYAASQIVLLAVSHLTGSLFAFDFRVLVGVLLAALAIITTPALLARSTKAQASIDKSSEVVQQEIFRSEATRGATMAVHDTLLATLSVIGASKPGPLAESTRRSIEHQLASLNTANWISGAVTPECEDGQGDWSEALLDVISSAEEAGLQVNVTGQADVIDKLGEAEAEALLAALTQCLSNVLNHSGQTAAEVVVLATDDAVTATIIDTGVGFDKDGVAPDRLGLKLSVRGRIENVGGTVNLWTGHGMGTAVMLKVPLGVDRG
jgi:signal transduction histidine kinase